MRFSLLTLSSIGMLSSAESRNILSGFVRPHPRFLIQSITSDKTPEHFDQVKRDEIDAGKFCQAPGELFHKLSNAENDKQSHYLYREQAAAAAGGVASTRNYIKKLETLMRGDTVRSASQIETLWTSSIVKELETMQGAVDAKLWLYESRLNHIRSITGNPSGPGVVIEATLANVIRLNPPKADPITSVNGKKVFSLDHDPSKDTVDSHSDESWKAMYKAYHEAKEKLKIVKDHLESILKEAKTVVEKHISDARHDTSLKIRWDDASASANVADSNQDISLQQYTAPKYEVAKEPQSDTGGSPASMVAAARAISYDWFNDGHDNSLAESAVWLDDDAFGTFVTASSESVSETLTRLTVVLSALHVRRLGLVDAKTLLSALLKSIMGAMDTLRGDIVAELGAISTKLGELAGDAQKVYRQANLFPGVQLDAGYLKGNQDEIDVFEAKLKEAVAENAHSEIPHRINLVANVMHRLHAHLLAFLVAHQRAVSFPDVQSAQENNGKPFTFDTSNAGTEYDEVKTSILSAKDAFSKILGQNAANSLTPQSILGMKEELSKHQERSRVASECLLYGRVDALGRNLPRYDSDQQGASKPADDVCKTTHALGTKIMAQLFPIEPHSSSDSASPNGGGRPAADQ